MKKVFLFSAAITAALSMQALEDYDLRVLTFEDEDTPSQFITLPDTASKWSSLIDNPQYGGTLLYGASGWGENEQFYSWTDGGNTNLSSCLAYNWGSYAFSSGGDAISDYCSADSATYGDYTSQLTIYKRGDMSLQRHGGGHNGSKNFCVHYSVSSLTFADNIARVIDHMYVTNTTYAFNSMTNGDSFSKQFEEGDWLRIEAYGYAAATDATPSDTAVCYLAQGTHIIADWVKFDLSTLGAVAKVELMVTGSDVGNWGLNTPAYFAFDDVVVRYPKGGTTSLPSVHTIPVTTKILRHGQLLMVHDGKTYTILGQQK